MARLATLPLCRQASAILAERTLDKGAADCFTSDTHPFLIDASEFMCNFHQCKKQNATALLPLSHAEVSNAALLSGCGAILLLVRRVSLAGWSGRGKCTWPGPGAFVVVGGKCGIAMLRQDSSRSGFWGLQLVLLCRRIGATALPAMFTIIVTS